MDSPDLPPAEMEPVSGSRLDDMDSVDSVPDEVKNAPDSSTDTQPTTGHFSDAGGDTKRQESEPDPVMSREMLSSRPKSRISRYTRKVKTVPVVDYDVLSGTPLPHLTFLLKHAPFIDLELCDRLSSGYDESERKLNLIKKRSRFEIIITGSLAEGLFLTPPTPTTEDDLSVLMVLTGYPVSDIQKEPTSKRNSVDVAKSEIYLLQTNNTEHVSQEGKLWEGNESISPRKIEKIKITALKTDVSMMEREEGVVFERLELTGPVGDGKLRSLETGECMEYDAAADMVPVKPRIIRAMKEVSTKVQSLANGYNPAFHVLPALPCPQWPSIASSWLLRSRLHGWPPENVLDAIKAAGCHVVQIATGSETETINSSAGSSWRISVSLAERILGRALSRTQRKAYLMMKSFYFHHFSSPPVVHSHWLKTLLFWGCEQTTSDFWREDNLGPCVLYLLDSLLQALSDTHLSDYFIEEKNVMASADKKELLAAMQSVAWVREHPCKALDRCYGKIQIGPDTSCRDLFQPVINFACQQEVAQTKASAMKCLILSSRQLGQSYLAAGNKLKAAELLDEGSRMILEYSSVDDEALLMLRLTAYVCAQTAQLTKAIEYFEAVCSFAEEQESSLVDLSVCLCNLATLYHSKYYHTDDEKTKEFCLERCQENFEFSVAEDFSLATVLHYSIFLLKWKKIKEARLKLSSALALTDERDEEELLADMTGFLAVEADTLDTDLSREVKSTGAVELPTVVVAYYVLCKALMAEGTKRDVEENVFILELLCQCENNRVPHTSWALLGYVKKALNDYQGALHAFKTAVHYKRDYRTAREEIKICSRRMNLTVSKCCIIL